MQGQRQQHLAQKKPPTHLEHSHILSQTTRARNAWRKRNLRHTSSTATSSARRREPETRGAKETSDTPRAQPHPQPDDASPKRVAQKKPPTHLEHSHILSQTTRARNAWRKRNLRHTSSTATSSARRREPETRDAKRNLRHTSSTATSSARRREPETRGAKETSDTPRAQPHPQPDDASPKRVAQKKPPTHLEHSHILSQTTRARNAWRKRNLRHTSSTATSSARRREPETRGRKRNLRHVKHSHILSQTTRARNASDISSSATFSPKQHAPEPRDAADDSNTLGTEAF